LTRKQLAKLVERWRQVLIPEWRVTLMDCPHPDWDQNEEDFWARCQTSEDYQALKVYFPDESLERSPREIEITVVHELLHALTRPWRKQIDDVGFNLDSIRGREIRKIREHEEEKLVDRLAYVLVAQTHGAEAFGTIERTKD
jgi:hypothetical protein